MSGLTELRQAKAMRDRSLSLLKHDLSVVRTDLTFSHVKEKAAATAGEMADDAADLATRNKGLIAAAGAALTLWFARKPIAALVVAAFGSELADNDDDSDNVGEHNVVRTDRAGG